MTPVPMVEGPAWTGRPRTVGELPDYVLPAIEPGLDSRDSEAVPGAGLVLVTTIPRSENAVEIEIEIRPPGA